MILKMKDVRLVLFNMAYDIDFEEKSLLKLHVRKFFLHPGSWKDPNNQVSINLTWKSLKFVKTNLQKVPEQKGIYCFISKPKTSNFFETRYLFYIGKTTRTLKTRYSEYLRDLEGKGKPRPRVFEMLKLYDGYLYFYYTEIANNNDIGDVEDKLINTFIPHINTDIPIASIRPELKDIYV
jgi:hypothetical protein